MKTTYSIFIMVMLCFTIPIFSIFINLLLNFYILFNRKHIEIASFLAGLIGSCLILVFQTYNILYFYDFLNVKMIGIIVLLSLFNCAYCLHKFNIDALLMSFSFCVLLAFIRSVDAPIKSIVFIGNLLVPFLLIYIFVTSKLRSGIDKEKIKSMTMLLMDLVVFWIALYSLIDLITSFNLYRFSSINLSAVRSNEIEYLPNKIPVNFHTSILGMDFLRYMGFIGDPLRSAYFGMFLSLLGFQYQTSSLRKIVYVTVGLALMFSVLSKGAFLTFFCVITFWVLLNYKQHTAFVISVILAFATTLFLATDTSTSGFIHLSGLIGPFISLSGTEFLLGDKLYLAGNMGRVAGEAWTESVLRGAESLIGTYMYAFGIIGVTIFIAMHIKMIVVNVLDQNNVVAAFIAGSLIVVFLQEGHYNSSQAFLFALFLTLLKLNGGRAAECVV